MYIYTHTHTHTFKDTCIYTDVRYICIKNSDVCVCGCVCLTVLALEQSLLVEISRFTNETVLRISWVL